MRVVFFFSPARLGWVPCCSREKEKKPQVPLLACSARRGELVPYGVRVGVCSGVRLEVWLGGFAHPLGGSVCRWHVQYPAFAPGILFLL